MKNKGLKTVAGFIIVLAATIIVLSFTIDGIVKSAIEEDGRELFQTAVEVSNVNISIWNGTSEIYGFTISNPDQFSDQPAIELDEIQLKIDLASMFSDTIQIENIRITGAKLFFEQEGFGINLRSLNQNMDLSADEDDAVIEIEHLVVENATVQVSTKIDRERTVEANIENIELEGIGRDGNNTLKQSMQQILEPLIERAIQEAMTGGLLQQLENRFKELLGGDEN